MNAVYLIPDDRVLKIVSDYLHRSAYEKGYVLDGFPRTITQAKAFENGIDKVIYLKISDKEALWRLSGRDDNREDNTLAAIRKRINLFHEYSQPVLEHYRGKGILIEIDGEKSIEEINDEIMSKIR